MLREEVASKGLGEDVGWHVGRLLVGDGDGVGLDMLVDEQVTNVHVLCARRAVVGLGDRNGSLVVLWGKSSRRKERSQRTS